MSRWRSMTAALLIAGTTALAQEPAQPSATPAATPPALLHPTPIPAPRNDSFYPGDRQQASQGMFQMALYLVLLISLFGAGIYVMRRGIPTYRMGLKTERKLNIEETRSLGGRQFLVVAEYEGQRMLLGVCPGRIDHLCALKSAEPAAFPKIAPEPENPA